MIKFILRKNNRNTCVTASSDYLSSRYLPLLHLSPAPPPSLSIIPSLLSFSLFLPLSLLLLCSPLTAEEWTSSQTVGFDASTSSDVAVDNAGNTLAVFIHSNGLSERIQSAYRESMGEWVSSDTLILPSKGAAPPKVSASLAGRAIAAWTVGEGNLAFVQVAEFSFKEKAWVTLYNLAGPVEIVSDPVVQVDSRGNAIVAWSVFDGETFRIQSTILREWGSNWRPLSEIIVDRAYNLDLALSSTGRAVLVWGGSSDLSKIVVQSAILSYGSHNWTQTEDVSIKNISAFYPHVVMDEEGNALVAWGLGSIFPINVSSARLPFGSNKWIPNDDIVTDQAISSLDLAMIY